MKLPVRDRIALLAMCLLAAYQVAVGIEGFGALATAAYTVAFGVLLLAGLLMIILGREVLESSVVVVVSTIIPLSLSVGLLRQYLPAVSAGYFAFATLGFLAVVASRAARVPSRLAASVVAVVHGVAGLLIFGLPFFLAASGRTAPGFALVGVGGALIGIGGLLLSFMRLGRPILRRELVLQTLPLLLLVTTVLFVAGFHYSSQ